LEEAERRLSNAFEIAPQNELLLYLEHEKALLFWYRGKRERALSMVGRLISDYGSVLEAPEHRVLFEQVHTSRGMLLTELGRYREAVPALRQCLSFDSRSTEIEGVLYDLGLCLLQLGSSVEARDAFQRSLSDSPESHYAAMAHFYLGTIYFRQAAYARALLEFEACLARGRDGPEQEYLYKWLAVTARSMGKTEDAQRYERLAGE